MWEQEEFAKHWRNEFPDGDVPEMDLRSIEDVEAELDSCKANLKRLQKALAKEKFKVIYLQTTVARQRRSEPERFEGKNDNSNADKTGDGRKALPRDDELDGERTKVPESGGARLLLPGNTPGVHSPFSRDRSKFIGRTGKPVPIPVPPRRVVSQRDTAPAPVPQPNNDNEEGSDREYEDVELNENFVRSNLLAPKPAVRDSQRTQLRPFRHSRDFDSGDDGRLSPSFPQIHRTASRGSGCSTPDRRSDGYLSSDHEDSSSAGNVRTAAAQSGDNYYLSQQIKQSEGRSHDRTLHSSKIRNGVLTAIIH